MKNFLWVGAGGFLGASIRYAFSIYISKIARFHFPISTLVINFTGCFLLGLLMGSGFGKTIKFPIQEFFVVGFLGGFTTFSAFGFDSYELLKIGYYLLSVLYIFSSILFSIAGILLGIKVSLFFLKY